MSGELSLGAGAPSAAAAAAAAAPAVASETHAPAARAPVPAQRTAPAAVSTADATASPPSDAPAESGKKDACASPDESFKSAEDEDESLLFEFSASGTEVGRVAYVQVAGKILLLWAGHDRAVHARLAGGDVVELRGHCGPVCSVVSARPEVGRMAGNGVAASCSWDGTVRLWGENAVAPGQLCSLHTLDSGSGEPLFCVDLTPDGERVVAGGAGGSVHVWTQCRSSGDPAAEPGARRGAHAELNLTGHTCQVAAVQVSGTGERIVSASYDGTVCVWRVAMDAASAAPRAAPPRKVTFRSRYHWNRVSSLALTADGRTVYAGMEKHSEVAVVDCESAQEVATLRSKDVLSDVTCLSLLEFGGGGGRSSANGRLFAGHESGLISEWDLKSQSCLTVYGDPSSGASAVRSITTRFAELGGDGRNWDRAFCGPGQRGIEFATGHVNKTVRVWRARSSCVPMESTLLLLDGPDATPVAPAAPPVRPQANEEDWRREIRRHLEAQRARARRARMREDAQLYAKVKRRDRMRKRDARLRRAGSET